MVVEDPTWFSLVLISESFPARSPESRIWTTRGSPTQAISALYERFGDLNRVISFYPDVAPEAISEAINLEHQLQPGA